MKIGVIGTGVYGLAIAMMLEKNGNEVLMWTESDALYQKYLLDGCIKDLIPGVSAPNRIKLTKNYEEVVKDKDILVLASTATYVHSICEEIKPYLEENPILCIASKGIENNSCAFLSDIVSSTLPSALVAVLSGPSFAIDMANSNPVGLSLASKSPLALQKIKKALAGDSVKVRETDDLIGVQLCGSVKNIIAVASGILAGLGYPESTQSFLITEAIHDIKSLINALGGDAKTVLSFAGIGDLLLTCTSTKSRNFSFGYVIGSMKQKEEKEQYLKENTVEGYYTLKSIYKLISDKEIEMPIVDLIYKIVMEDASPTLLVDFLIHKK